MAKKQTKKITGVTELRNDLLDYYSKARSGEIQTREIVSITQLAGKIISSAKTQLQYHAHMERQQVIPFLEK